MNFKELLIGTTLLFFFSFSLPAQTFYELSKHVAPDRDSADYFGRSVTLNGAYALIGSRLNDTDVDGNNSVENAGAAYVYKKNDDWEWEYLYKLTAADRVAGAEMGFSIASDGNTLMVGAPYQTHHLPTDTLLHSGAVHVFRLNSGDIWEYSQTLVSNDLESGDHFGWSISIDGSTAIIGAPSEDHNLSGGSFKFLAGSAYVFSLSSDGLWEQSQKLITSDRSGSDKFSTAVAINGDWLIGTATGEDQDPITGTSTFEAGSAYMFNRTSDGIWLEAQKITAPAPDRKVLAEFGTSAAILGGTLMVGMIYNATDSAHDNIIPQSGACYVFQLEDSLWNYHQKLVASDRKFLDKLGNTISMDSTRMVVSAYSESQDDPGLDTILYAGAFYVFDKSPDGFWSESSKVIPSTRAETDFFSFGLALQGRDIVASAPFDDEDVDEMNYLENAGSIYFFSDTLILPSVGLAPVHNIEVMVHPNPIVNQLNVSFGHPISEEVSIALIDGYGRVLLETQLASGSIALQIAVDQYPSGVYLTTIETVSGIRKTFKLIKH